MTSVKKKYGQAEKKLILKMGRNRKLFFLFFFLQIGYRYIVVCLSTALGVGVGSLIPTPTPACYIFPTPTPTPTPPKMSDSFRLRLRLRHPGCYPKEVRWSQVLLYLIEFMDKSIISKKLSNIDLMNIR